MAAAIPSRVHEAMELPANRTPITEMFWNALLIRVLLTVGRRPTLQQPEFVEVGNGTSIGEAFWKRRTEGCVSPFACHWPEDSVEYTHTTRTSDASRGAGRPYSATRDEHP